MSSPPEVAPVQDLIAADTEGSDDADSALNLSTTSSSTSITSSILHYREENGRRYHREGVYVLPNDDSENDRLDLQHHLFYLTFNGKLHTCPAGQEKQLHRVLDVGTGTGIWAMDFADEHPETQVVGIDISPIQPRFVPPNLDFFVDDIEQTPWTFSTKFDFIYGRMLTGSLADWPQFFRQSYENLNPGGWIEVVDIGFPARSDDDSLPPDCGIMKWSKYMVEATETLGRSAKNCESYKTFMQDAGFINVVETIYKWPQNSWPKDKRYKELGMWTLANIGDSLSGLSLALFTRGLGWNATEVEIFLVEVRRDMKNRRIHAWWPIYVVYAQKPE